MNFRLHSSLAYLRLVVVSWLLLTAGCGPQQVAKPVTPVAAPTANAEARLRNGDFLGAAAEYSRLANGADAATAQRYQAMAAFAYLDGDDPESARVILSNPPAENINTQQLYALALAASDSFEAGTIDAAQYMESVDAKTLTPYQRSVYYRTLGRISIVNQEYSAAASALVAADAYALSEPKRTELHANIWRALSHIDDPALESARADALRQEQGWLDLAVAARPNLHNSAALAAAIETWRVDHPQHPANLTLVEQLFELSESLSAQTRHIALLLPFNGAYANAANAIRDGFLSAWYAASRSTTRPTISVYSVDATSVNAVYDTAVSNGADMVVGPLEKSTVEVLTARAELPVRTLVLNVADSLSGRSDSAVAGARFFQFGLTPEDEAAAAAEKAWSDGYSRALALAPDSPWGRRLTAGFSRRWVELGGVLLTEATYGGAEISYAQSVKQALNIDLSEARAAELRRALNRSIHFEPRRRTDVDVIFLAGFPLGTRQVLPQLRYFRAESVPVYSTSHTYSGRSNAAADQDLDGLRFGDMPWLFGAADSSTFNMFKRSWPDSAPGARRLFAFGLDAYRILPYLARMRHQPSLRIPGTTGQLRMDGDGRVIRELSWAQFAGGVPTLMNR